MKRGVVAVALLLLLGFAALFTIRVNSEESAMVTVGTGSQQLVQSRKGGNKTRTRWASISLCWGGDHYQTIASKYIAVVVQRMPKYTERRTFHTPKLPTIHPCCGTAKLKAR